MSLAGCRIVTDTGVDRYEAGPERTFQRSTAAHATLQVDGCEQAETFGSFRMGRRPRVRGRRLDTTTVEGDHDGFGPLHRRTLRWEGGRLAWTDVLESAHPRPVTVRVGLAVGILPTVEPGGAVAALTDGTRLRWSVPAEGTVDVEPGVFCPTFGRQESRAVLRWRGTAGRGRALTFSLGRA
jgi:hypothetical protein